MRRVQVLFLLALLSATAVILFESSLHIGRGQWTILLFLSGLIFAGDLLKLFALSGGHLTFAAGSVMLSFLVAGPHLAVWAVSLGVLVDSLTRGAQLKSLFFNLSQLVVVSWFTFRVFYLLDGQWAGGFNHPLQALVASCVYFVSNYFLVALYLHLDGRASFLTVLRGIDVASVRAYMITMMGGILVAFAYLHGGLVWAATVVGMAYMLHTTLKQYFSAVNEARSQTQQLEAVLNATQGALIMTDQAGIVKVANRQVGVLFGLEPERLVGRPASEVSQLQQIMETAGAQEETVQVVEMLQGPARFLHWYRAAVQDRQGQVQGHVQVLTDVSPLKEAEGNLRRLHGSMITALTAAIDARDSYTHGHSARVAQYSVILGRRLGMQPMDLERIQYAALLHDIGKLGIDDRVLGKRGPLSPTERAMMMQHPGIGADVLRKADVLTDLIPGVRWHHEWVSGGGYPDGLKGEEIPLDARIISVADAFDAMTTDRQYRAALPVTEALNRVLASSGMQFDADVAQALAEVLEAGELKVDHSHGRDEKSDAQLEEEVGMIRPVHAKELSVFYQLSRADYTTMNLDTMLNRSLETFHDVIGSHLYMIYLTNPVMGTLELCAAVGVQSADNPAEKDSRLIKQAAEKGIPVAVKDFKALTGYRPAGAVSKSEVVIPLMSRQELLGVLVVEGAMPGQFQRDDVYLFETLGQQLCSLIKLARYHERLKFAASHDSLTGVFNHSYFYDRMEQEVERGKMYGDPVSVAVVDVHGLKAINDSFGHIKGDEVLRAYATLLQTLARPQDVVARHGGSEFAIILPGTREPEARLVIEHLVRRVEERFNNTRGEFTITASAWGIASYPDHGERATELVLVADRNLYDERLRIGADLELEMGGQNQD